MTTQLPQVNVLVRVQCSEDGQLHRSRVEAVEAPELLIAAPHVRGDVRLPRQGSALTLQWSTMRGSLRMPVQMMGVEDEQVPLWRLSPAGEPEVVQRRRFARASAVGGVMLVPLRGGPLSGPVIDISEESVRCRLTSGATAAGRLGEVHLDLDDDGPLVLPGEVLRTQEFSSEYDDVIVVFRADDRQTERIRRYVLSRQRHERRMGRT